MILYIFITDSFSVFIKNCFRIVIQPFFAGLIKSPRSAWKGELLINYIFSVLKILLGNNFYIEKS